MSVEERGRAPSRASLDHFSSIVSSDGLGVRASVTREDDEDPSSQHADYETTPSEEKIRAMLKSQYPCKGDEPTMMDIIGSILTEPRPPLEDGRPRSLFKENSWLEIWGEDQKWHLCKVQRVIRQDSEMDGDDRTDVMIREALENFKNHYNLASLPKKADTAARPLPQRRRESVVKRNSAEAYKEFKRKRAEAKKIQVKRVESGDSLESTNISTDGGDDNVSVTTEEGEEELKEEAVITVRHVKTDYFYNSGHVTRIPECNVRASREGLEQVFGGLPFLWQQYALLKYESVVRFQEQSEFDFEALDPVLFAKKLFKLWLENSTFRDVFFHKRLDDRTRTKLKRHLYAPFEKLNDMRENKGDWDFTDSEELERVSAFTYLSVLGTGLFIPLVAFGLQFIIFQMIVIDQFEHNGATTVESVQVSNGTVEFDLLIQDWSGGHIRCPAGDVKNTIVILGIVTLYAVKVVPDLFCSFYETVGTADSLYSRLMSLRQRIADKNEDTAVQKIGYIMDLAMNTCFKCSLYALNLVIIFKTEDLLDVILNCIALEFVADIDEGFVSSDWWDPGNRWIKAGTMELLIRAELELDKLSNFDEIWDHYLCDYYGPKKSANKPGSSNPLREYPKLEKLCRNTPIYLKDRMMDTNFPKDGFWNRRVAEKDAKELKLLSTAEASLVKIYEIIENGETHSKDKKDFDDKAAKSDLFKKDMFFGFGRSFFEERVKNSLFRGSSSKLAVFNKHKDYRTWSFFQVILFNRPVDVVERRRSNSPPSLHTADRGNSRRAALTMEGSVRFEKFEGRLGWANDQPDPSDEELTLGKMTENLEWVRNRVQTFYLKSKGTASYDLNEVVDNPVARGGGDTADRRDDDENDARADPEKPSSKIRSAEEMTEVEEEEDFRQFKNWDHSNFISKPPLERFLKEIFNTVTFRGSFFTLFFLLKRGRKNITRAPAVFFYAFLRWIVYSGTLILFPLLIFINWCFLTMYCLGNNYAKDHLRTFVDAITIT